jgi:hypothetical protein
MNILLGGHGSESLRSATDNYTAEEQQNRILTPPCGKGAERLWLVLIGKGTTPGRATWEMGEVVERATCNDYSRGLYAFRGRIVAAIFSKRAGVS